MYIFQKKDLRAIPDSDIGVGTNGVINNYMFLSKIRHTSCPIHIHQSSMKINIIYSDIYKYLNRKIPKAVYVVSLASLLRNLRFDHFPNNQNSD